MSNPTPKFWCFDGPDGIDFYDEAMLEDFFRTNEGAFEEHEKATIRNLEPNVSFAVHPSCPSPDYTIWRMTDDEVREGVGDYVLNGGE